MKKLHVTVDVPIPSDRYINDLIGSKCFADLLLTGFFKNAKELTTACAAFRAAHRLHLDFNSPNVAVICIGGGPLPATAAMFAFRTRWHCYSVDPKSVIGYTNTMEAVQRVWQFKGPLRDFKILPGFADYVFVRLSNKCSTKEIGDKVATIQSANVHGISVGCEKDHAPTHEPTHDYFDSGIWGSHQQVKIWKHYKRIEIPEEATVAVHDFAEDKLHHAQERLEQALEAVIKRRKLKKNNIDTRRTS